MTRLLLVAGEASGDLHGGMLARALREADPGIELYGIGGAEMEGAGVRLIQRCESMGVTGFWEVLSHLPTFRRILDDVTATLRRDRPTALIPIDYPDFNMRLAERAHGIGVPVIYYISPQVWAWRRGRIRTLRRVVRRMIVIFPFEEELYRREGIPVSYVGHPLVDRVRPGVDREAMRSRLGLAPEERLVALLPGSRPAEIERMLPLFLETRRTVGLDRLRWAIALAPGLPRDSILRHATGLDPAIPVLTGETYALLSAADLALTTSGTATLEGAILGTPMIVVYRMHPITWRIARLLVRVPHVAMANLLAGRRLVPEFLQGDANPRALARAVREWIGDADRRKRTSEGLREAASRLGPGGACGRAARVILDELSDR